MVHNSAFWTRWEETGRSRTNNLSEAKCRWGLIEYGREEVNTTSTVTVIKRASPEEEISRHPNQSKLERTPGC